MSFSNTCSLSNNSNSSSSSEDATSGKLQYTESDDEGSDEYCEGGYHPVKINEIYNNRYRIEGKLGWGHFSTVWVATDLKSKPLKFVAIKIQKGSETYTESAKCEINYLNTVKVNSFDSSWVELKEQQREKLFHYNMTKGVVSFIDSFEHKGPNGTHICMVFEFMGPNLLSLIKHYDYKGIPLNLVRKIATHVLIGMQYLHDVCKIIHSDIKPENVLVSPLTTIPKPKDYTKDKIQPNKTNELEKKENDKNEDKKLIITIYNNINKNISEQSELINDTKKNDKNIKYDEKYTSNKDNIEDNISFVNHPSDTNQKNNINNNISDNNSIPSNIQIEKQSTINKNEKNEKNEMDSYININNSLKNDDQNYKREDMQYNDNKEAITKYDILNDKNNISTKEKINDCESHNGNKNKNINNQCQDNSINIYNNKNNNIQTSNINDNTNNEKINNTSKNGMSNNTQNNHDSEKNNVVYEQQLVSENILKKKTKNKKKNLNEPPYVKHKLRPSNSDPSLLTSYSNIHALQETLTRKPYHYNTYFLNNPEKYRDNKMNPYLHRLPNDYLKKFDQDESDEIEEEDDHSDIYQNKNQLEGNFPNSKCQNSNDVYKFFEKDINKFPIYCDMFNHLIHPEALRLHDLYMKNKKNIDSNNTMNDLGNNQNSHKVVYINTEDGDYCIRPYDPSVYYHEKSCYKICDLGNSLWIDESRYAEIQTRQYRAPEVILKSGFNETADIWSFACMVFELVTGDFLFNPQKGDRYDKNEEHLSFIIEVLGNIPKHMIDAGYNSHKYFNKNNYRLKNIRNIKKYGLYKILKYKYNLPEKEISPLCSFLLPMLSVDPQTRPSAYTMLQHPWLNMVSLEEGDDMYINDESYSINNDGNIKNNSNSNNFIYDDYKGSKNKNSSNRKKIDVNYKIGNNGNNAYNDDYYNKNYKHDKNFNDVVEQQPDQYVHANYKNDVVHAILCEKPYNSNNVISYTNNKGHKNNLDFNYSQYKNDNNSSGHNISLNTNDYTFNSDYIANMMDNDTYRKHIIKNIPAHEISKLKDGKNFKAYNESIQYAMDDFQQYNEHDFEYKFNKRFEQPHHIKGMKHNNDDFEEEEDEDDEEDDDDEEDADNDEDDDDEDYEDEDNYDEDEYDEGQEHHTDQDEQDNKNKKQEQHKYGEEYNYAHYENKMDYNKNIQPYTYTNNNDDKNNLCEAQNSYILKNKRDINFKECTTRNNIKKEIKNDKYQSSKIINQKDNYWNYQIKENTKLREHVKKQHYSNNNNINNNNIMNQIDKKDQKSPNSQDLSSNNNMNQKHGALQKMDMNQKTNQDKPLNEEENLFENRDDQNVNKINCKVINKKTPCAYT
ncbi:serine/threonine protein kinase [Plasmodium sp. DRC-Itaito]|nr:serine/threonine protein kinase [Plasmodium sp. DRC-Itaito]